MAYGAAIYAMGLFVERFLVYPILIRRWPAPVFGTFLTLRFATILAFEPLRGGLVAAAFRHYSRSDESARALLAPRALGVFAVFILPFVAGAVLARGWAAARWPAAGPFWTPLVLFAAGSALFTLAVKKFRFAQDLRSEFLLTAFLWILLCGGVAAAARLSPAWPAWVYAFSVLAALVVTGFSGGLRPRLSGGMPLLREAAPFTAATTVSLFADQIDKYSVAYFLGAGDLTLYYAAASIPRMMFAPFDVLDDSMQTHLTRKSSLADVSARKRLWVRWLLILSPAAVLLGGAVLGKPAMALLYGKSFWAGGHRLYYILLAGTSLGVYWPLCRTYINQYVRAGTVAKLNMTSSTVTVGCAVSGAALGGITGAATGMAVGLALRGLLFAFLAARHFGREIFSSSGADGS
jgi:O-antigen/teichoic acid export membrane protein